MDRKLIGNYFDGQVIVGGFLVLGHWSDEQKPFNDCEGNSLLNW